MPTNRGRGALLVVLAAVLVAGCSSEPEPPPTYRLTGDACGAVNPAEFAALTRATPAKKPSKLVESLDGGNCAMEFDGAGGYVLLTTFIAIHPSGEAAAKARYDDFRQKDGERVTPGSDLKVVDVEGLGTAAYLYRQHDDSKPWTPGELWLYKYIVRHGSLLLTVNATGTAREGGDWPTVEQEMQDKVKKNAEETMKALRA